MISMGFPNFVFGFSSVNVLVLGLILSFNGFLLVQSQQNQAQLQASPPPPLADLQSPPKINTPPPPPPNSPPPPSASPPPPPSPSPPSPPPPSKPTRPPPPPPRPRAQGSPPPPHINKTKSPSRNHQSRRLRPPSLPSPPPPQRTFKQSEKSGLNTGKTVGLVFAGFAAMLQICVVAFLVFKRKQLLRMTHTY